MLNSRETAILRSLELKICLSWLKSKELMEIEAALITTAEEAVVAMVNREEAMEVAVVATSVEVTEVIEAVVAASNVAATAEAIEEAMVANNAEDMEVVIEEVTEAVVAKEAHPSVITKILASLETSVSTPISVKLR
jgi:hypothetical protein